MRKIWDPTIDMREEFVPRKKKVYLLSREERDNLHKFINKQLRKRYIKPSKLPQITPVFFVEKKDVGNIWYRTINI